jgi:hypothetical protein
MDFSCSENRSKGLTVVQKRLSTRQCINLSISDCSRFWECQLRLRRGEAGLDGLCGSNASS